MAAQVTPEEAEPSNVSKHGGKMFSLRIVNLEHYMASPLPGIDVCYSQFQGRAVDEVPVIRIYGSTPSGQKTCLHLHQVFPYFYVPYEEDLPQDINEALAYVRCLASAIEKAMKLANSMAAKKQHVHSCSLVRAHKYYGYYPSEQLFIKIVLYHPQEVASISALLLWCKVHVGFHRVSPTIINHDWLGVVGCLTLIEGGGIMNRIFQPHESHIPYLLQLLIDQNLSGMSHLHLFNIKFRHPLPERPLNTANVLKQLKAKFAQQTNAEASTSTAGVSNKRMNNNEVPALGTTPSSNERWGSSAGSNQSELWLGSSIPANWIWPSHYSTGGPFAKHSTCELEADASVEDILNRQELLFMPLQQAGPAIKLVQSLTPIWEEERLRSGEDGPAGATAALKPSPERFLSPPFPLEQALRDSLFQMVHNQDSSSQYEPDTTNRPTRTQETLLECTQAANLVKNHVGGLDGIGPRLDLGSIGAQEGVLGNEETPAAENYLLAEDCGEELFDEHIVRTHFTQQGRTSQEIEKEVADLLDLLGASQEAQTLDEARSGDEEPEEGVEGRGSFSQIWGTASMQAAMIQALSEFESATQKECQEILDCVNDGEGYKDDHDKEDLREAALQDMNFDYSATVQRGRMHDGDFPFRNFQLAGAGDDLHDLEVEPQRQCSAVVEPRNYSQEPDKVGAALENNGIANMFESLQEGRTRDQRSTVTIPQMDGPGDSDSEEEFSPEPKRMRMIAKDSTRGPKKEESLRREEKETSKRSGWGSLPMSVASPQRPLERQVIRTEANSIKVNSDIEQDKCFGYLEHHKEESSTILERRRVRSLEKRSCSEVSLRALMRKQRERQPRRNEDSTSSSKSLTESQSEQFRNQPRITVKPEVETCESSAQLGPVLQEVIKQVGPLGRAPLRYQEREDMSQTSIEMLKSGLLADIDKGIELAESNSPRNNHIRKLIGSGIEEQLPGIVLGQELEDELEFVRKLEHINSKNLDVKAKQEICGQWGFNLLEGGDHRDCGGGGIPSAVPKVANTGSYGCVEMPLEERFSNEETLDKNLSKEYADLYLASSIGLTNLDVAITGRSKHSKNFISKHVEDAQEGSKMAEGLSKKEGSPNGADRSAPEASKALTNFSSAKQAIDEVENIIAAAIGSTQLGEEGVGDVDSDSGIDAVLVTSEIKVKDEFISKDQGITRVSLSKRRSLNSRAAVGLTRMQSYPPTSEEPMLPQQRVGDSGMLWKEKTAGKLPLNTEKCKYVEDPIADRAMVTSPVRAVPDVSYRSSEPKIKNGIIMDEDLNLGRSPSGEKDPAEDHKSEAFHKETTDNLVVVFTSMSDRSEDSFEWGSDFGSFYRSEDSDEARQERSEEEMQWLPSLEVPSTVLNIREEEVTSSFQVETRIKSNVSMDEEVVRQEDGPFRKKAIQDFTFKKEEPETTETSMSKEKLINSRVNTISQATSMRKWCDVQKNSAKEVELHTAIMSAQKGNPGQSRDCDAEIHTTGWSEKPEVQDPPPTKEEPMTVAFATKEQKDSRLTRIPAACVPSESTGGFLLVTDTHTRSLPVGSDCSFHSNALAKAGPFEGTNPHLGTFQKSMQATRPEAESLSLSMTRVASFLNLHHGKETVMLSKGVYTCKGEDDLLHVKFHQKPPSKEALLASLSQYGVKRVNYEGVVYGDSKDVPGQPTISAGLIFDLKTRGAQDLPPFLFGSESKKSSFSGYTTRRDQMKKEKDLSSSADLVAGVPCNYENDGSVTYLLTPAKPPPSSMAVRKWLSETHPADGKHHVTVWGETVFTMDANTGKLVPNGDIGSNGPSQEGLTMKDSVAEDMDYFRPASPKYDEKHVLAPSFTQLAISPAYALSRKKACVITPGVTPQVILNPTAPHLHPNSSTPKETTPVKSQVSSDVLFEQQVLLKPPMLQVVSQEEKKLASAPNASVHAMGLPKSSNQMVPPPSPPAEFTPPQLGQDEIKQGVAEENRPDEVPEHLVRKSPLQWRDVSQITAPSPAKGQLTPLSQSGFRDPASVGAGQQVTLMSIEMHMETRGNLRPDPRYDAIGIVVIVIHDDEAHAHTSKQTVVLIVDPKGAFSTRNIDGVSGCVVIYLPDELSLLKCFVHLVRLCDPDILVGWEIQGYSLGLLAERAANLGFGLLKQLSRTPPKTQNINNSNNSNNAGPDNVIPMVPELWNSVFGDKLPLETVGVTDNIIEDEWGRTHGSGLFVGGRIILNLWRIMRGEVKLGIYTLEAVAEAVLRRRVPRIPWRTLTKWFVQGPVGGRFRCIEYYIDRAQLNLQIMEQLDLLNRTAELARVFGIDFYSVFSRGSQYRVESMMLRLAHTQNFLLLSPSRPQVAGQPAMECLPLVMEPESRFYTSPVVVLDFQALYPSMIIAYNLCFSTCLGKIVPNNPKVLGVTNLDLPPVLLKKLKDCLTITPNGVLFTPPEIRQGVVPRLLTEILSTRIMVKKAMKELSPDQRVLQRVLNARQFALKLIANVTYGYTAAGFSGRMPCAELADSIVQCGRLTLERAIHLVNSNIQWDARVVYGDTDSMFVLLEGRTREEAFKIGQEIAAAVTATNPTPVTLKMEKVYHPCVLLTKKRYVGYSYESPGQLKPTFDAKGIETVRRDSCAAVAKILERSLRTLFETQDLSQVKHYLQRQWGKILRGRISIHDFIFAKEVRLGTYSARASVLPAAAIVASKAMSLDPRAEPRYAERVPYVVVHGEPGARLSDVVVDPHTMLANGLRLHDTYYITKQIIPTLQRVFGLVGADLMQWYAELPRVYRPSTSKRVGKLTGDVSSIAGSDSHRGGKGVLFKGTIDHYYLSQHCSVCGELMRGSQLVCTSCMANPQAVVSVLTTQTAQLEKEFKHLEALCRHCGGQAGDPDGRIACTSIDCPIFFERCKVQKELQASSLISSKCDCYLPCSLNFTSELF